MVTETDFEPDIPEDQPPLVAVFTFDTPEGETGLQIMIDQDKINSPDQAGALVFAIQWHLASVLEENGVVDDAQQGLLQIMEGTTKEMRSAFGAPGVQ
ncbi:MAG: hypothetical protein AAF631_13230 [Pseudomonadota bacterium]